MPDQTLLTHMACRIFLAGIVWFGLFSLWRERAKYLAYQEGRGDVFSSSRRYRRRVMSSVLLIATGLLLYFGVSSFHIIQTPVRFMLFVGVVLLCCLGTFALIVFDLMETSQVLSRHYDGMIEQSSRLMRELAKGRQKEDLDP